MEIKRVCFTEKGVAKLETQQWTDVPDARDVITETQLSLISPGTELASFQATHIAFTEPQPRSYPLYPGYASIGRVIALGREREEPALDTLLFLPYAHASHMKVNKPTSELIEVSASVHPECALFARLALIAQTAIRMSTLTPGDTVVVQGLGLIGNLAAQLFQLAGAKVIGFDRIEERVAKARQAGIQNAWLADGTAASELVKKHTAGQLAEIVIESTGVPKLVDAALRLVAEGGQVVLLGSTRGLAELDVYRLIHCRGVSLIGAHERVQYMPFGSQGGRWNRHRTMLWMLDLIETGKLQVENLVTHRFKPDAVQEAYDMLAFHPNEALGVLIDWRKVAGH